MQAMKLDWRKVDGVRGIDGRIEVKPAMLLQDLLQTQRGNARSTPGAPPVVQSRGRELSQARHMHLK